MRDSHISMFTVYLMATFLLISTFMAMVISESNVIEVPIQCPPGTTYARNHCRDVF
uniref:Venom peptide ECTX1-Rm63a n=1 Tax=Rhytidoponera metallica TaxID=148364 RepID=A0A8U0LTM1_RHYMT|nr:venom peptide precursor ECTX1-Rm63a [Rhytidoponera metallica]